MDRASPFSFECAACGQCCRNKRITLFPYELARLAAACGTPTGAILAGHTDEGGTVLRMDPENGACTFLRDGRCGVHAGRPLACRLYPLGRHSGARGEELFETPVHDFCKSRRNRETTAGAFLDSQDIAPYVLAADRYGDLLKRMVITLKTRDSALEILAETIGSEQEVASPWLDVDAAVNAFCSTTGARPPASVEDKITLHLQALEQWIAAI